MFPKPSVWTRLPQQKWPVRWPALQTVWSAPGPPGQPAPTAVPLRLQRADRAALALCWPSQGKVRALVLGWHPIMSCCACLVSLLHLMIKCDNLYNSVAGTSQKHCTFRKYRQLYADFDKYFKHKISIFALEHWNFT